MHIYAADKIFEGDIPIELRHSVCVCARVQIKKRNCYWENCICEIRIKKEKKDISICVRNCFNELQFIADSNYGN